MHQKMIQEILAKYGLKGFDPRHVEAWMRMENPTLDGLSKQKFAQEVKMAVECIKASPKTESERLAVSFGL